MKIIQTTFLKFVTLLFAFTLSFIALAQDSPSKLKKADSLFTAKLYTQSFELYHELFNNKTYTPAMLLKMAFIQEGLGHLSLSLYYLNLYSTLTHDSQADEKVKELATKNNLEGYHDSQEQISRFLQENKLPLMLALVAINGLLLSFIVFQKNRKQQPLATTIILAAFLGLLFWLVNFGEAKPTSIISSSNTYLMEGPSSGSAVLAIITEGHKLTIEGSYDVWLKTTWKGKAAFVKQASLLPLNLN